MVKVVMYTTAVCPFCINAKHLLEGKGVAFEEIRVDRDPSLREKMTADSGQRTVPLVTPMWAALPICGRLKRVANWTICWAERLRRQ